MFVFNIFTHFMTLIILMKNITVEYVLVYSLDLEATSLLLCLCLKKIIINTISGSEYALRFSKDKEFTCVLYTTQFLISGVVTLMLCLVAL